MIENRITNKNLDNAKFVNSRHGQINNDKFINSLKEIYETVLFLTKNLDTLSDRLVELINTGDGVSKKMATIMALSWCFNFRYGLIGTEKKAYTIRLGRVKKHYATRTITNLDEIENSCISNEKTKIHTSNIKI